MSADYIEKSNIAIVDCLNNKDEIFRYLASFMRKNKEIPFLKEKSFYKALWEREEISVTGVGNGVAIPHAQKSFIKRPVIVFIKSNRPIPYESLVGETVQLIFMIAVPDDKKNLHLQYLAKLSRKLMNEQFVEPLIRANTVDELYSIVSEERILKD